MLHRLSQQREALSTAAANAADMLPGCLRQLGEPVRYPIGIKCLNELLTGSI